MQAFAIWGDSAGTRGTVKHTRPGVKDIVKNSGAKCSCATQPARKTEGSYTKNELPVILGNPSQSSAWS